MNINFKSSKKIFALLFALTITLGFETGLNAVMFGNSMNGASTVERYQVRYDGAAWNHPGMRNRYTWASFRYSRRGRTILSRFVRDGRVTGSVWDDLIDWGDGGRTYFGWNNG